MDLLGRKYVSSFERTFLSKLFFENWIVIILKYYNDIKIE